MTHICEDCWLVRLISERTCDLVRQMSGIQLTPLLRPVQMDIEMDAVYGFITGCCEMQLRFDAGHRFFCRIARNMGGGEEESGLEVRDYAEEFFNVLCGRIVSEICRICHIAVGIKPTHYAPAPQSDTCQEGEPLCALYFQSDEREMVRFSWSQSAAGKLMKRGNCDESYDHGCGRFACCLCGNEQNAD